MKFIILLLTLLTGLTMAQPNNAVHNISLPAENVNSSMNMAQKRVREAAVKILGPLGGHGSGSYIVYKDAYLVLTAQHVTDGPLGTEYKVVKNSETRIGTLIWHDVAADMAVLHIPKRFVTIQPMKWNPQNKIADVGTITTYSGYPSDHTLMTFSGVISGYGDGVGKQIILNSYGWFGCSGSVIYTLSGDIVGILYGVDVEYYPGMQVQENMIWVAPIQRLKIDAALKRLCKNMPAGRLRACR